MYMELLKGVKTKYGDGKMHVLKLLKNLYGQRQGGLVWNLHLVDKLLMLASGANPYPAIPVVIACVT